MAFTAAVEWDVRTTGSDSNGGGFAVGSGGTDYSQQDSPAIVFSAIDYLAIDAVDATKCTSNGVPFDNTHVGNIINVTGGTGFTVQRVQVISVASGVATCDKSLGTLGSTGGTGNLGGSLLSPSIGCNLVEMGNTVWIKSGTYNITVDSAGVAGGKITIAGTATVSSPNVLVCGYEVTHGDMSSNRPLLQVAGTITGNLCVVSTGKRVENLALDGNGLAITGLSGSSGFVVGCKVSNFTNVSFAAIGASAVDCWAANCTIGFSNGGMGNVATNCTTGFICDNGTPQGCIAIGCTVGFRLNNSGTRAYAFGCTAYGGVNGFVIGVSSNNGSFMINCLSVGNTNYQFTSSTGGENRVNVAFINCAAKADGVGAWNPNVVSTVGLGNKINCVTLTADPFVNAAGGDFSLNGVTGGGALLKAMGLLGTFPGSPTINTIGYQDIGASQSKLPGRVF